MGKFIKENWLKILPFVLVIIIAIFLIVIEKWRYIPEINIPFGIGKVISPTSINISNSTTTTKLNNENYLSISFFDLAEKMYNFPGTSVDKENYFKKYIGLSREDEGYVLDVSSGGVISVYFDRVDRVDRKDNPILILPQVVCRFNSEWAKTATALEKGQKVRFYGVVSNYNIQLGLEKCELR